MRQALLALLLLAALLSGCSSAPLTSETSEPTEPLVAPPCTHADTNNYGTNVQDLYVEGGQVWQETNGISNLQKAETCEGPADTQVAP